MTSAQIHRAPDQRSAAEVKRSTGGKARNMSKEEKEKPKSNSETFHALKMQRALSSVSYHHRNDVKDRIAEIDTFDHFKLLPAVRTSIDKQAFAGLEEIVPTPIQRITIPALLGQDESRQKRIMKREGKEGMEQFLIAAETGSGKTLAYLIPVLDAIKRQEVIDNRVEEGEKDRRAAKLKEDPYYVEPPQLTDPPHSTMGRPRAIILLPTSELVSQVSALAKTLSHEIKFRSGAISSSYTPKVIRSRLFSPSGIDVLICTPHLLSSICETEPHILSRVTHLVIDEADSLMDRSFAPTTSSIIDKTTPSLKQLILCSATIPRSLDTYLRSRFPDMRRLVTPNLHAIPRRVQLGVVDVEKDPYRGNKLLACADTIWSIGKAAAEFRPTNEDPDAGDIKRLLVFVNEREKTLEVAEYLQSKGIDAVALSRDTPEQRQGEILAEFTTLQKATTITTPVVAVAARSGEKMATYIPAHLPPPSSSNSRDPAPPSRRSLPGTKVLVTTDLGSRGIDTLAVRHVILYDVPHSTIDFIHRLGRTGRMGRRGRGIVLVGKGDRRDVVREVREGMFRGQALI
jgi:ATP-dependent RNA helicase MRH4